MLQYIGARYVPRFMGTYDNTQVYEALDVVDNGLGTSYIAKIPVPAGTPLTNTTYWAIYGASSGAIINLQNQIGDLTDLDTADKDSLVDAINENVSLLSALPELNMFKNKTVCIVGDSISDTTTYPPNWTVAIESKLLTLGATSVTNASITGSSLVGFAADLTLIPTGYDIYIIALGVNDWQGQFKMTPVRDAIYAIMQHIDLTTCECYYVSPLKQYMSGAGDLYTPLNTYRAVFETIFESMGAHVISGYNAPNLSTYTKNTYLADNLHPASVYREILADYILGAMISKTSTFSPTGQYKSYVATMHADATYTNGAVYLGWYGSLLSHLEITLLGLELTGGAWNNICYLAKDMSDSGLFNIWSGYVFNETDGNVYQVRANNGIVQIYSPNTVTTNFYLNRDAYLQIPSNIN